MNPDLRRRYPFFRLPDLFVPAVLIMIYLIFSSSGHTEDSDCLQLMIHSTDGGVIRLALDADTVLSVQGNLGLVEIQISGDSARIQHSPCPGQDCVRQGWLHNMSEMAICVPSGVFIHIEPSDAQDLPDAVSY